MRGYLPDGSQRHVVDVPHLLQAQDPFGMCEAVRAGCLTVDPVRGIGVAAHLHVLAELLVAHRPALGEEPLHLLQDQGVALDGGRVMGFLVPDAAPDVGGLDRRRESAHALSEFLDLNVEAAVDVGAPGPAATRRKVFVHDETKLPNTFGFVESGRN